MARSDGKKSLPEKLMSELGNDSSPEPLGEGEDKRDRIDFWLRWIPSAKKAAKCHWDDTKAAYQEYEYKNTGEANSRAGNKEIPSRYPIYWSSVKTLEPAYYAKTPVTMTNKMFGVDDDLANTMALIVDRLGDYFLKTSDFDDVMSATVLDFIHGDKATAQAVYKLKTKRPQIKVQLMPAGDTFVEMTQEGQPKPYDGPVEMDDLGPYYMKDDIRPEDQEIKPAVLRYRDVIHTPEAKMESEIVDKAFKFCMDYHEAIERFGEEKLKGIKWQTSKTYDRDEEDKTRVDLPGKYIEGWECYSRRTNKVYWVVEDFKDDFLDVKEDPYGIIGLFPCTPFIISSKPSEDLYPTPAFVHVEGCIRDLHDMQKRVRRLLKSIRRRCIIDGSVPELKQAIEDLADQEYITVSNLAQIIAKGGMANMIHWVPVQELVAALPEMTTMQENYEKNFNNWFGVPDILRGYSDPNQPMGATEIQQQSAHDRFKKDKKRVQDLARNLLELEIDMALKVFVPEKIMLITGFDYMEPVHQERFPEAFAKLQNDEVRLVRIDIETDSTTFQNDQIKASQAAQISTTISQGIQSLGQVAQSSPHFVPGIARSLLAYLEVAPGGKQYQDSIKEAVKSIIEAAANPPQPPPPPPDYEGMKLEIAKMNLQIKQQELAAKQQEAQMQMQIDTQKMDLEAQLKATQIENERIKAEQQALLDNKKIDEAARANEIKAMIESGLIDTKARIESIWQEIDKQKIILDERERFLNKQLEAQQMALNHKEVLIKSITETDKPPRDTPSSEDRRPSEHLITPIRDGMGNATAYRITRA